VNGFGFDQVIIVKDKDNPAGDGGDLVGQDGQDGPGRRRLRGRKGAQLPGLVVVLPFVVVGNANHKHRSP
jgi:hypothetical protein